MRESVEVETESFEDARLIARALKRILELESRGSGVRIRIETGGRRQTITGRAFLAHSAQRKRDL